MGTSEKLDQMLQNVPEVYHSGQLEVVKNAECLKGFESGASILLDDVSPVEHTMSVKVNGKNLFNQYAETQVFGAYRGIDVSALVSKGCIVSVSLKENGTFQEGLYFGYVYKVNGNASRSASFFQRDTDTDFYATQHLLNDKTYENFIGVMPNKLENWQRVIDNYNIQIEIGSTATEYEPYIDLTDVKVGRLGSNIFDGNLIGGIYNSTDLDNPDTSSSYVKKYQCIKIYLKAGTYTLSSSVVIRIVRTVIDGVNKTVSLIGTSYTFSVTTDGYQGLSFRREDSADWDSAETVWINMGSTAISYEPYTSEEYSPNSDGTVDNVTSIYPNTTLMTDTEGVTIDCNYYKDINKTFDKLTTSVALSGGDS